ncbi:MAG: tetratricopeptide repeat protein [Sulfuritalea sp.]|nr:tetratricopeptide repeat protein [Sulfuritalea sp.]
MNPLPPLLLAAVLLAGCASLAPQERPAPAHPPAAQAEPEPAEERADAEVVPERAPLKLPHLELTPALLNALLLAEVAAQRGQLAQSAELYLQLARETRDPRIARRGAEIGLHARRHETALEAARIWQETEPGSAAARQAVIGLMATLGRFEELRDLLPPLLAAEPRFLARNLLHLNRFFVRVGDRRAVQAVVDAVTAPYLGMPEAHFARAHAAFDAREIPAARTAINRALELRPSWEAAALLRAQLTEDRAEAIMALGIFLAANPGAREARLAYARALAGERRYAEARREFRALLDPLPADPARAGDLIFALALLSLQLDDAQDAERQLRRLVELGHAQADKARFYLGRIAADGKRLDEALQWFGAVGRGEHYLDARLGAASLLARQGRLDAAREHLRVTETANPQERARLLLGEAQLLREAGRHADAHAALSAALVHQPDQPELLYEVALLAERIGRFDELESRLRRLLELKPDHAHALNALGYSLADRNIRLDEARDLIERALALAPDDPYILDSKGWVLYRQGQLQAAYEFLRRAFGLRPDAEIAAHLGEVLWKLGRKDEARQVWDKALKESPANEVLAETIGRFGP